MIPFIVAGNRREIMEEAFARLKEADIDYDAMNTWSAISDWEYENHCEAVEARHQMEAVEAAYRARIAAIEQDRYDRLLAFDTERERGIMNLVRG